MVKGALYVRKLQTILTFPLVITQTFISLKIFRIQKNAPCPYGCAGFSVRVFMGIDAYEHRLDILRSILKIC